mgnify:CR=1 FL=1
MLNKLQLRSRKDNGIRTLSLLVLIAAFLVSCNEAKRNQEPVNERPNIIIILADDMGYSDLGCYGGEMKTPNLDGLAFNGLRFTQFYNAARCCPTRASLLTGLYPHQAGIGGMVNEKDSGDPGAYQGYLNKQCVTIAEVLKGGGYYTAASGKWHVGEERPHWPTDRGFDNYYGLISGGANYFDITKGKRPGIKRHFAIDSIEYLPPKEGFYMTDAITENALTFLDKANKKKDPFFLYLAYTAPHWPLHALQEDIDKYQGQFMEGWDELRERRYERMLQMGLIEDKWPVSERDPEVASWDSLTEQQKEDMDLLMSIYAAQIDRMDQGIGRVIEKLESTDKLDNTLILFLSDNGGSHEGGALGGDFWGNFWDGSARPGSGESYHSYGRSWANLSNTPFRMFKSWIHEGGIATPLIAHWPNRIAKKGGITNQPGHIIDIMTTVTDVADVEYPATFKGKDIIPSPGKSLAPIFQGEKRTEHEFIFWEHLGNRGVRMGDWKLVSKEKSKWELYNLTNDKTEENDVFDRENRITNKMLGAFTLWAKKNGVVEK